MKTTIAAATLALAASTPAMAYDWTINDCQELHAVTVTMATEASAMRLEQRSLSDAHQAAMDIYAAEAPANFASWRVEYSMAVTGDVYEAGIDLIRAAGGAERVGQRLANRAYEFCVKGVE